MNFDQRGFMVRQIYGMRPQVYQIPGTVEPRHWFFPTGFCVRRQSLTEALKHLEILMTHRNNAKSRRVACVPTNR
jgi:hypothetical protein